MGQGRLIRPWPIQRFFETSLSGGYLQAGAGTTVQTGTLIVV